MKKHLLPVLMACLTPLCAEETELGFQGSLPENNTWKSIGSLTVQSVDEGGVKVLSFADESESDFPLIFCKLNHEMSTRMRREGYTLDVRFKHMKDAGPGGNFSIMVGLPGLCPLQISPYYGKKGLIVSAFDFDSKKNLSVQSPTGEEFVNLRAIFRPNPETGGGTCELTIGGDAVFVSLGVVENSPRSAIEIGGHGGGSAQRTGTTFVESLKLSIP